MQEDLINVKEKRNIIYLTGLVLVLFETNLSYNVIYSIISSKQTSHLGSEHINIKSLATVINAWIQSVNQHILFRDEWIQGNTLCFDTITKPVTKLHFVYNWYTPLNSSKYELWPYVAGIFFTKAVTTEVIRSMSSRNVHSFVVISDQVKAFGLKGVFNEMTVLKIV